MISSDGGTGRHASLRGWWPFWPCRFKSCSEQELRLVLNKANFDIFRVCLYFCLFDIPPVYRLINRSAWCIIKIISPHPKNSTCESGDIGDI